MKKLFAVLVIFALILTVTFSLVACKKADKEPYIITVGASQTPHSEILNVIKDKLASYGWTLKIKVFDDYTTPNTALDEGSLDANYFQHEPYLEEFNKNYKTDLVSVGKIHYEPFGLYGKNVTREQYSANGFKTAGRKILIPNDGSNRTRALFLLQDEGFITLRAGVTARDSLTIQDIVDKKGNTIEDANAEALTALLRESDTGVLAVINGNYALQANLKVADALATENAAGDAAQLYANVIAVQKGKQNSPKTKALLTALRSKEVYDYILATYNGAVVPVFTVEV